MDRLLKPDKFDGDPDSSNSAQVWNHWFQTFNNFLGVTQSSDSDKLKLLVNLISPNVYERISHCESYIDALNILRNLYVKPVNEIFARHKLSSRRQEPGESIDKYLEALKLLGKHCNFKAVSAETNRDDSIRDTFIGGLSSPQIRQRLLERPSLSLQEAYEQARSLELAGEQAQVYASQIIHVPLAATTNTSSENDVNPEYLAAAGSTQRCFFCGWDKHNRELCPAREAICKKCGKRGHYGRVCKSMFLKTSRKSQGTTAAILATCKSASSLSKAVIPMFVNGSLAVGLIDTGSSLSFIDSSLAKELKLKIESYRGEVMMASTSLRSQIEGQCRVTLEFQGHTYSDVELQVIPDLCSEVILGHDVLSHHESLEINFGGIKPPLTICGVAVAAVEPAQLFNHLSTDCRPITVKSRRVTRTDANFIDLETKRLLEEDIIEPSNSPWRAQVLVTPTENHRRRMVVDYSRTINRFTLLDAYPLPRVEDIVNSVAAYNIFSTIDLKGAYHQVPIPEKDRHYTAFEAGGRLYHFKRIPFGVTNGVASFQRIINEIIEAEKLEDTYAYLDDVTICGTDQEHHDRNLRHFMEAVKKYNLTINKDKSVFSKTEINLLGCLIQNGTIKPDPERLKPLKELPPPTGMVSLRRCIGMFSHYSRYIPHFSKKILPLTKTSFPLTPEAEKSFNSIKKEIEAAVLTFVDPDLPFTVETDASDQTIAATLSQDNRPVAFFSRTLNHCEHRHSSVEKEAYAIVESLRKWRHYLLGKYFQLITDQRSVAFMFDNRAAGKIKNEKIMRWRLELSPFKYNIVYRPGRDNVVADAFSRVCASLDCGGESRLKELHETLCHPGITRLYHWVRSKNLTFSLEDIRKVTNSCKICAEIKPRYSHQEGALIKATAPFERLAVDFKGPLPSDSNHRYILTVVDEFSRFPYAFPCKDVSANTVIQKFTELFSVFGLPSYVHSDRGSAFMSQELKSYLHSRGVATSRTTPYNPRGNGQVERYNGTIWKTVQLALKSKEMDIKQWEQVLPDALHAIRSLLCTSTNSTPHDRLFTHPRRSSSGQATPNWLMSPGPILLRKHNRQSKYDPAVEEVYLLEANPQYAHIRLPDGHEATVSTRHLAPIGESTPALISPTSPPIDLPSQALESTIEVKVEEPSTPIDLTASEDHEKVAQPRRSQRARALPTHLKDYVLD